MPKAPRKNLQLQARWSAFAGQFKGLRTDDPASWPLAPRLTLCFGVLVGIVVVLWMLVIRSSDEAWEAEKAQEVTLRADYSRKLAQAINLELLRKQREQVQQYVNQLEKQLPGKAEMDALLSDINQAGLGRSLHFDLFRPGQVVVRAYYAELPIAVRVTGRYHDVGAFAADIANLSRIVTLNNLVIAPGREGMLTMEATAKTFRYLDPEEIKSQKSGAAKK